jgi:hypothetical protein
MNVYQNPGAGRIEERMVEGQPPAQPSDELSATRLADGFDTSDRSTAAFTAIAEAHAGGRRGGPVGKRTPPRDAARDHWRAGQGVAVVRFPASGIYDDLHWITDE